MVASRVGNTLCIRIRLYGYISLYISLCEGPDKASAYMVAGRGGCAGSANPAVARKHAAHVHSALHTHTCCTSPHTYCTPNSIQGRLHIRSGHSPSCKSAGAQRFASASVAPMVQATVRSAAVFATFDTDDSCNVLCPQRPLAALPHEPSARAPAASAYGLGCLRAACRLSASASFAMLRSRCTTCERKKREASHPSAYRRGEPRMCRLPSSAPAPSLGWAAGAPCPVSGAAAS
jgi:hypothetical protein